MYEKKRPPPDEMLPTWLKTYPGHCKIICHETDRQKETRKSKQEILWCGFELLPESGTHRQETLHLWIKLQTTAQRLQCHTNTWLFWLFLHAMARIQLIFLYYFMGLQHHCPIYIQMPYYVNSGVVVRERGGAPFWQIFWSRNGTPANITIANTQVFWQIMSYSLG